MRFFLLCLVACGATEPPESPEPMEPSMGDESQPSSEQFAQTPFTAAQIRDATPVGRLIRLRQEMPGQSPRVHEISFIRVSSEGCTTLTRDLDEAGASMAPSTEATATWEELRAHAQFPASATTITEESIDVPAGHFQTLRYTVALEHEGTRTVQIYWFAPSLPGPPVQLHVLTDGEPTMTMTLIEHRP